MPDFGFVGAAYVAPSITQNDQDCLNWYPEVDMVKNPGKKEENIPGDRGVIALYPTPGLSAPLAAPYPGTAVRALYVLPDRERILVVSGDKLFLLDTLYNETEIATLASFTGPVKITDNGTSAYICDGVNRYYYTWGTGTFAIAADGPFLNGTFCDEIDNFIVYNRPGTRQWGSTDVGTVVSNALNLGQKLSASDNLVALMVANREVRLLGELTTEVWTETGSSPFAFQAMSGTTRQHGIAAAYSLTRMGEGLAWLSQDDRGRAVFVNTVGYDTQRISTHAIENDIADGVISDCVGFTYQQEGHEFAVWSFPTQDKTWCFDFATRLWHRRAWRDDYGVLHRHRANCAASFNGQIVVGDWENGNLYAWDRATFTDNGDTILRRRRCPHITKDLDRVFHHSLQIQFQPGVGLATGQGSDPKCILRWSNDGGFTFGNDHELPIGKMGKYKNRAIKRQLGEARDRVYEVDVTDPIDAVVVSANLVASAGAA